MLCVHRNSTGVSTSDAPKYSSTAGLRPILSAMKPKAMYPAIAPAL